jgi:protein SCO1/2
MRTKSASQYWHFFVTDSLSIKRLTEASGWEFKRSGNDFVHSAGTILLTPRRKINQYFYGTFIYPMQFHLAVVDAKKEISDPSRIQDPKYCYNFTPPVNKSYNLIVSSAGILVLLAAAVFLIWLSLNPDRRKYPGNIH